MYAAFFPGRSVGEKKRRLSIMHTSLAVSLPLDFQQNLSQKTMRTFCLLLFKQYCNAIDAAITGIVHHTLETAIAKAVSVMDAQVDVYEEAPMFAQPVSATDEPVDVCEEVVTPEELAAFHLWQDDGVIDHALLASG